MQTGIPISPANFGRVDAAIMREAESGAIDTFIFDFDGVLGDGRKANVKSIMEVIYEYGFAPRYLNGGLEALCSRHSPEAILTTLVPELSGKREILSRMVHDLSRIAIRNTQQIEPTPLVRTAIALKDGYGSSLAVATNRKGCAIHAIRQVGLEGRLDTLVTSLDAAEKPDKAMIELAMRRMGSARARTMFIGDNREDLLAGRAAGVKTILVQWGRK
ncbi:MAG: HAD-IA family hydrolase [Candidatus Micrarchaeia archaeon]